MFITEKSIKAAALEIFESVDATLAEFLGTASNVTEENREAGAARMAKIICKHCEKPIAPLGAQTKE